MSCSEKPIVSVYEPEPSPLMVTLRSTCMQPASEIASVSSIASVAEYRLIERKRRLHSSERYRRSVAPCHRASRRLMVGSSKLADDIISVKTMLRMLQGDKVFQV